jgi:antitoxin PrlF
MRVTSKGQVTIPQELRAQAGLHPGSEVTFKLERGRVYIEKAKGNSRGETLARRLTGRGDVKMTTDEILALTRER